MEEREREKRNREREIEEREKEIEERKKIGRGKGEVREEIERGRRTTFLKMDVTCTFPQNKKSYDSAIFSSIYTQNI